ncbi:MAG: hypothetical protein LUE23_08895 [Lachnospiraceae bacterium]|nr:hypothetical protein [Lachnospiraceae bacterium]
MANDKYLENMQNNPLEICAIVHKNQTFAVKNGLTPAGEGRGEQGDENQPLRLYSSFSRFALCIIQDHASVVANLRVKEIPGIIARSHFCFNKEMEAAIQMTFTSEEKSKSIAYTQVLSMGQGMKGKTPAQFLLEAEKESEMVEKAIDALKKQYIFLRSKVKENPKFARGNQAQMDAITEAVHLYRAGNLNADEVSETSSSIKIAESGFRPLVRRKRPDGKCFVAEYAILWSFGKDYPVTVSIKNYYAPVIQTQTGTLNVKAMEKSDERTYSIKMSADEWMYVLHMIEANLRVFENAIGPAAYHKAVDQNNKNRLAAIRSKEQDTV